MGIDLFRRGLIIWFGLFVLAFLNGAIREVGIKRIIDEPWAHHLSALTAVLIFSAYVFSVWSYARIETTGDAARVGAMWFVLTVLTETLVLNRWMSKLSWQQILQSYDVTQGHLWPVVLIWVGLLPVFVLKLKAYSR